MAGAEPGPGFEFTFDGRPVRALPGQSIAAALWAASVLSWRTTRVGGRPRGAFCGIGSCFECLATVNGRPNLRACLLPARPGDAVTTQEGNGHAV
nr:(2Fe-2S)-binding protein [Streptomyces sp. SID9124]